ncbi:uncharacterized protein EV154DRAFT_485321 [Mucor mucedo]|uniref:uncharacterized protein n=1 Tax=Mucor mucedo TaxID=29922 RepID=UPI00221E6FC9|nr:uncharacterized protein EV154DRAFT_485321 [Mucor mucedo]KAI7884992.1 hypothetical protein EV154DRAFT_485321 [Mucor mucedo]
MEDIQSSFDDVVSIDHSERSIVNTPIISRPDVSPTVPVVANDLDLKTSIDLDKAEVHSLSLYVAADPESDLSVNNKHIRLNKRIGDIVLLKKAAKALQVELQELTKADEPTMKIEGLKKSHVVPRNLPAFCWKGHNNIPGVHVLEDINTCIRNFMDVMNCHGLDLNSNYLRVIPACLSGTTRTWFEEYLSDFRCKGLGDPTWNNFAVAFKNATV